MKKKIKYTDEILHIGERVKDMLPPPGQLIKRKSNIKITLEVTEESLVFFKKQAKRARVPYQRMMRALIDTYAQQCEAGEHRT
jgi:hypothetical protein